MGDAVSRTIAAGQHQLQGDYGNSDFDTRNGFVGYANYEVPGFKGPKLLTNGWELNTVITLKGGQPINLSRVLTPRAQTNIRSGQTSWAIRLPAFRTR